MATTLVPIGVSQRANVVLTSSIAPTHVGPADFNNELSEILKKFGERQQIIYPILQTLCAKNIHFRNCLFVPNKPEKSGYNLSLV